MPISTTTRLTRAPTMSRPRKSCGTRRGGGGRGGCGATACARDRLIRGLVDGRCAGCRGADPDRPRPPSTALDRPGGGHRPRLGGPLSQRAPSIDGRGSMTLVLERRQANAIRQHGEADYPAEACGLIGGSVEDGRKVAVLLVPLVNQRTDAARNRYLIDPESFRRAQEKLDRDGLGVIGVDHSHPDHAAAPSTFDREHAWPWLSYVIVGVARGRAGEMTSWTLSDDRAAFDEESITIEEQKAVWQSPS